LLQIAPQLMYSDNPMVTLLMQNALIGPGEFFDVA
jgi:hypothetical protein